MFPQRLDLLRQRLWSRPGVAVGIDAGRSALRVVALRRHAAGFELAGLAWSANETGADVPESRVLADTVRRACRSLAWRPRRVVMGVSGATVLAQPLVVPASADAEETAEAVERVARTLPLPLADVRLAWAPLPSVGPAQLDLGGVAPAHARTLLLVAARREAVRALQEQAASSGLGRVVVDVDTFAALRALRRDASPQPGAAGGRLLIDAGRDSLRLLAWPDGGVPLLRVVPLPAAGAVTELAGTVVETVASMAGDLGRTPAAVVLAGGRMLADDAAAAVAAGLAVPCQRAEPFAALSADPPLGLVPRGAGPAWLVAMGLALRGLA